MALIRPPTPDDAPRLGEVHVAAWRWAYRGQMSDDLLDSLRPESRAKAWHAWLTEESNNDFAAWVAEEDGDIIGFAASRTSRDDDAPDRCAELLMIYLLEDYLGRGIGHQLINAAETAWRANGYEVAILWVLESNTATRAFYEREGWVTDGETKDHAAGSNETRPAVRYTKLLD
jgi:GNAT superfamily N-acetyltransferase